MTKSRKSLEDRKAELLAQKQALEAAIRSKQKKIDARLAALGARERKTTRKQDAHLKIVMGAAVQAHARLHPAWAKQLHDVLHAAVLKDRDRQAVAAWFARLAAEAEAQVGAPQEQQQARAAA